MLSVLFDARLKACGEEDFAVPFFLFFFWYGEGVSCGRSWGFDREKLRK